MIQIKKGKKNKEDIAILLMQSSSLYDLLEILENICKTLILNHLNPKIKHFRYFQFTFFGLMVKAKSLLEKITFKVDFIKQLNPEFENIYCELILLQKRMHKAYIFIKADKMIEGKNEIIQLSKDYQKTYETIKNKGMMLILK